MEKRIGEHGKKDSENNYSERQGREQKLYLHKEEGYDTQGKKVSEASEYMDYWSKSNKASIA